MSSEFPVENRIAISPSQQSSHSDEVVIGVHEISKRYGGVQAVNNVSMSLFKGEALALIGSNGAGKSTLVKILTGAETPDSGHVLIDGVVHDLKNVGQARTNGIGFVPQELMVANDLSVSENVLAAGWKSKFGFIGSKNNDQLVKNMLDLVGLEVSPGSLVARLSPGEKRLLMIARTLAASPQILILDEPTAALADLEAKRIISILRKLVDSGISVIYISHRMSEIEVLCDRVLVIRDGVKVLEGPATKEIISKSIEIGLVGTKNIQNNNGGESPKIEATSSFDGQGDYALQCNGLTNRKLNDVSFDVRIGEIVGFSGLLGSGRSEILRAIAGADPLMNGEISLFGKKTSIKGPHKAVAAGIGHIPEDRRNQGGILGLSIRENLVLPSIPTRFIGWLDRKLEKRVSAGAIDNFSIKCSSYNAELNSLSGGNQQKVILARWVLADSRLLLLDEPTAGVDVVAKTEILSIVKNLVRDGRAALMVSSEIHELTEYCDRIYVVRDGSICEVFNKGEITAVELAEYSVRNTSALSL